MPKGPPTQNDPRLLLYIIYKENSGQETALHYDSPYFLDVSRKTAPVWLLVALKQSGIWDHKEVHQIQGVAYMSRIQTYDT